jgi:hypothetical protein
MPSPARSPAGAFKTAQEAALRASADLKTAMGLTIARIYTEVPANAPLPYVLIGQDQVLLDDEGCATEAEIFSTVGLWSRASPLDKGDQARAIGDAIIAALAVELTIVGWDVDLALMQSETYATDPDQSTHGTLVFHYLLTRQVA